MFSCTKSLAETVQDIADHAGWRGLTLGTGATSVGMFMYGCATFMCAAEHCSPGGVWLFFLFVKSLGKLFLMKLNRICQFWLFFNALFTLLTLQRLTSSNSLHYSPHQKKCWDPTPKREFQEKSILNSSTWTARKHVIPRVHMFARSQGGLSIMACLTSVLPFVSGLWFSPCLSWGSYTSPAPSEKMLLRAIASLLCCSALPAVFFWVRADQLEKGLSGDWRNVGNLICAQCGGKPDNTLETLWRWPWSHKIQS